MCVCVCAVALLVVIVTTCAPADANHRRTHMRRVSIPFPLFLKTTFTPLNLDYIHDDVVFTLITRALADDGVMKLNCGVGGNNGHAKSLSRVLR